MSSLFARHGINVQLLLHRNCGGHGVYSDTTLAVDGGGRARPDVNLDVALRHLARMPAGRPGAVRSNRARCCQRCPPRGRVHRGGLLQRSPAHCVRRRAKLLLRSRRVMNRRVYACGPPRAAGRRAKDAARRLLAGAEVFAHHRRAASLNQRRNKDSQDAVRGGRREALRLEAVSNGRVCLAQKASRAKPADISSLQFGGGTAKIWPPPATSL